MHNIDQVSAMLQLFNNVVEQFGKTSSSVQFFKKQVSQFCKMGQLKSEDADYVYKLLGISNTQAIKWDIQLSRLGRFVNAMNYMVCCENDQQRKRCADQMLYDQTITRTEYDLIAELYGLSWKLDGFDYKGVKTSKFGSFGYVPKESTDKPDNKPSKVSKASKPRNTTKARATSVNDTKVIASRAVETVGVNKILQTYSSCLSESEARPNDSKDIQERIMLDVWEKVFTTLRMPDGLELIKSLRKEKLFLRVRNHEAACQNDPRIYRLDLTRLFTNTLNDEYDSVYYEASSIMKDIKDRTFYIEDTDQIGEMLVCSEIQKLWRSFKNLNNIMLAVLQIHCSRDGLSKYANDRICKLVETYEDK